MWRSQKICICKNYVTCYEKHNFPNAKFSLHNVSIIGQFMYESRVAESWVVGWRLVKQNTLHVYYPRVKLV